MHCGAVFHRGETLPQPCFPIHILSIERPLKERFMQSEPQPAPASKAMVWTGRVMSTLPALFLLFGGVMNVLKPDFVVQNSAEMGYAESVILPLGIALIASTILYLIPRTSV